MRAILFAASFLVLCAITKAEPTVASPDKRYLLVLRAPKPDSVYPIIVLRDARTGRETEVFDYDSVGQGTTGLSALWSPDSRYVALTIAVGPSTQDVGVYRIENGNAHEIEILPLPKALDTKKYSFRGGPYVDRWEDNQTLWIGDSSKSRVFRYRFTKSGKLRADRFEERQN